MFMHTHTQIYMQMHCTAANSKKTKKLPWRTLKDYVFSQYCRKFVTPAINCLRRNNKKKTRRTSRRRKHSPLTHRDAMKLKANCIWFQAFSISACDTWCNCFVTDDIRPATFRAATLKISHSITLRADWRWWWVGGGVACLRAAWQSLPQWSASRDASPNASDDSGSDRSGGVKVENRENK